MPALIAIITFEPVHWEKLSSIISSCGLLPVWCETLAAATNITAQQHFELAICDDELPDGNFRELVARLRRSGPWTPVIVVSRFDDWVLTFKPWIGGALPSHPICRRWSAPLPPRSQSRRANRNAAATAA